jgi:hypothetical protein
MDALEFFRQSMPQIEPILYRHSVSMLLRQNAETYDEPSSGTVVEIAGHYFIMTAGHVIPKNPNDGNLWLLNKTPRNPFSEGVPEFVRFRRIQPYPDVGYLEISKETVDSYLACEPCSIERLACRGTGRDGRHIALVGNPSDFARPITHTNARGIVAVTKAFLSSPFSPREFPTVSNDAPPVSLDIDVFVPFNQQDISDIRTGERIPMRSPHGYSGGGIWDLAFEPGQLWNPDHICVIGIQSSYSGEREYMRGVQTEHWLRMIYEDYEECRHVIQDKFPEQFPVTAL